MYLFEFLFLVGILLVGSFFLATALNTRSGSWVNTLSNLVAILAGVLAVAYLVKVFVTP